LSITSVTGAAELQDRVWLALRFGWTLAEVYGRLAEDPLVDTPSASKRLFISDLNPTPNERLWAATKRLAYLTRQLFPPSKKPQAKPSSAEAAANSSSSSEDRTEGEQTGEQHEPESIECPKSIDTILQSVEQRLLTYQGKLPRASDLYAELNQWSRQVWATLDAEDPLFSAAATLGARLADTFWQWRFPGSEQPAPAEKQTWKHLLKSQRMIATIRQVREVEKHLPAHVGPMLRHSLWEWGIAGELGRSPAGRLQIAHSTLYQFRSQGWARALRHRRMKNHSQIPQLTNEEQVALWKQLQNQMVAWENLAMNQPVSRLLRPSDWRQVHWQSIGLYAAALLLVGIGGGALVAGFVWLAGQVLGVLLPFLAAPKDFKDQLTLASTIVAVLAFLLTQFRRGLGQLHTLYDSTRTWVMMRKLEQRGLRAWDGRIKPLRWIWLQRLLRAEDE
jgi:hypothetical protein